MNIPFEDIFITVLNMSITGSYIIAAILLLRLLLKKAPKVFSYSLWAIAGLRLLCPFSFSSVISIFNLIAPPSAESSLVGATANGYIPQDISIMLIPEVNTGIPAADTVINTVLPSAQPTASVNPMQIILSVAGAVWGIGILAMCVYGIVSVIDVKKKIKFATKLRDNIFECDCIPSPFVFGIIKPKIYLPCGMSENQLEYVLMHEKNHIRRFDHITRTIAFIVLILHWFNPFVWIGYTLAIHDMEMSCDESVLKKLGTEAKKAYSFTLVSVGADKKLSFRTPLSFGENGVEKRVKNILGFKKPKVIAVIVCVVLCVVAAAVCLTNGISEKDKNSEAVMNDMQSQIEARLEEMFSAEAYQYGTNNYEIYTAGAKIAVTEDEPDGTTTVYGRKRIFSFDISYEHLIRYEEEYLYPTEIPPTSTFKASFDNEGKLISVEDVEGKIPQLPETVRYDFDERDRAYRRAEKQLKAQYSKIKIYTKGIFESYFSGTALDGFEAQSFELAGDCFGNPVAAISFSCVQSEKQYRISDYYELTKIVDGERIPLESKTLSDSDTVLVPTGKHAGREVLYFAYLSKYIDALEKCEYEIKFFVQTEGNNAYEEYFVKFKVDDLSPSKFTKPSLTYDTLNKGYNPGLFEVTREEFVSGEIYPCNSALNKVTLSEKNLKQIKKLLDKAVFTYDKKEMSYPEYLEAYTVELTDEKGRNYNFTVYGNLINDSNAEYTQHPYIELNSDELFNYINETYPAAMSNMIESGYETSTNIFAKNPYPLTTQTDTNKNIDPTSVTEYIVSNIKFTSPADGLKLIGFDVSRSFINISFLNEGTETVGYSEDYTMDKLVDGQWQSVEQIKKYQALDAWFTEPGGTSPAQLCTDKFYLNLEGGTYRIHLPVISETKGNITVEFTVKAYMITEHDAFGFEGTPVQIDVRPKDNDNFFCTDFTYDEMLEIAELYGKGGFEEEKPTGILKEKAARVTVIDNKGFKYSFIIYDDGVINIDGRNYANNNGKEIYELLTAEIYDRL
ncbi:MAG: hypothetical protein IKU08_00430 [Clostridia bacterium]|nr:hypothetical protein [Clostridia bacterium]